MTDRSAGILARCWWLPAAFAAVSALVFFKDFGVGWDDPLQSLYGEKLISYYSSGGADESYAELADLRYYGGAFELPVQLLTRISPWTPVQTRRLAGALVGALGVLGCSALGSLVGGAPVAWLSGGLLATWPAWVGHSFINSKDIPFATAFVWAVYFLVRVARAGISPRLVDLGGFALSGGFALGVRAGGLVLFLVFGCLLARGLLWVARSAEGNRPRLAMALATSFALSVLAAWALMMIVWPWAQAAPLSRPLEAAELMTHFPRPMEVLFRGKLTVTTRLPWDYVLTWLGATLPSIVVILLLALPLLALSRLRSGPPRIGVSEGILVFLAGGPLIAATAGRVVLYDGIRQILFVVPLLMVAAAWTAVRCFRGLQARRWRLGAMALGAFLSLDSLLGLVRLHPYQYVFFNRFVGGLPGAAGRFETDYWGLALREAAEWVNLNRSLLKSRGALKVLVPPNCAEPASAGEYLDPVIRLTDNNLAADFVLAPTRFGCDQRFPGTAVFRVERQGVVLAVVKVME